MAKVFNPHYYEVLGVSKTASPDEITRQYRKLARACHPDVHPDDPEKYAKFQAISEAYDILGNEDKRKQYDLELFFFDRGDHPWQKHEARRKDYQAAATPSSNHQAPRRNPRKPAAPRPAPPPPPMSPPKMPWRNRLYLTGAGFIVLLMLLGLGWRVAHNTATPSAPAATVQPVVTADGFQVAADNPCVASNQPMYWLILAGNNGSNWAAGTGRFGYNFEGKRGDDSLRYDPASNSVSEPYSARLTGMVAYTSADKPAYYRLGDTTSRTAPVRDPVSGQPLTKIVYCGLA